MAHDPLINTLGLGNRSKPNTEPPKCHWLSATGFQRVQIQIPINFTMCASHVRGKQPDLQKAWFLEI